MVRINMPFTGINKLLSNEDFGKMTIDAKLNNL
jgi:hypothetical protein